MTGATVPNATNTAIEKTAATVDEAVRLALAELSISTDDAEIEIISSGTRSVPGETVTGGEARVRVRPLDDHTKRGRALLAELLERMSIPARITIRRAPGDGVTDPNPPVILDIGGEDLGLLIGWRGETLRAVQTVVNLMLGEEENAGRRVIIDVERYRARREDQVRELAQRSAHRVKRSGERHTMDPMHAYERRAVHMVLADDEGVRTESIGKDQDRRIVIHATGPAQTDLPDRDFGRPRTAGSHSEGGRGDYGGGRSPRREYTS